MAVRPPAATLAPEIERLLRRLLDPAWYAATYPDVAPFKGTPTAHFFRHGLRDRRNPNPWFDSAWYVDSNPDVAQSRVTPLLHYLEFGAAELRNPTAHFDATFYTEMHPEAAGNPLLFHSRTGHRLGYATEWRVDADSYLPSGLDNLTPPEGVVADVIVSAGADLAMLRRCLAAVRADASPHLGRVLVLEDPDAPPPIRRWLQTEQAAGRIVRLRRHQRITAAAALNMAIEAADEADVVLLDATIEVPVGWLARLAAQAHADKRIATVAPFCNAPGWNGFPHRGGGALPLDLPAAEIDAACRRINRARAAVAPAMSRLCAYIRRDALRALGPFGHAEIDPDDWDAEFSLRASLAGWQNRTACDLFIRCHDPSAGRIGARDAARLGALYPDYPSRLMSHQRWDRAGPARFAVLASLLAATGKPVLAMVTHFMGGGVRRQIDMIAERVRGRAHVLLLEGWVTEIAGRAVTDMRIAVPDLPGGHIVTLAADQVDDAAAMLRAAAVSRVHIHHLLWFDFDTRTMIRRLAVPFDVTVHDNHVVCPQLNMLPQATSFYCGEPDIAVCNACIAVSPSANQARDILSWRLRYAWQFAEAERVISPSEDMRQRLRRFGLGETAIVAPHEPVTAPHWNLAVQKPGKGPLRVVLIGTLANHKGSRIVAPVVETAPPGMLDVHCIGELEDTFPPEAAAHITATGRYREEDLPALIRQVKPHVAWLPSTAPESYSFTLSAAIDAGLPIVASNFGAFPERLAGRPYTWLVDCDSAPETWLDTFRTVRQALASRPARLPPAPRPPVADFYATDYLAPPPAAPSVNRGARPVLSVVAERFDSGHLSPCAFIRLLQPFTHPDIGGGFAMVLDDAESVLARRADIIATQRHAVPDLAAAEALSAHARRSRAALVYDLDDDLLNVPPTHPDAAALQPKAHAVRHLLETADAVWLGSEGLKARLATMRPTALVVPNGLDERLWAYGPPPPRFQPQPLRLLCMGSATHADDLAVIMPALQRLHAAFPERLTIDIVGMTPAWQLVPGIRRVVPPFFATQSYPAFVHWLNLLGSSWHIGLAPLVDTPFNRCKSPIKVMDYAALGLAALASDMPVYRGSLADDLTGFLVANTADAWLDAMIRMVRDQELWRDCARRARAAFLDRASLRSQAEARRAALQGLLHRARTPHIV